MKEKLVPLALDGTQATQPLFSSAEPLATAASAAPEVDTRDVVDAWVDEHPTNDFTPPEEPTRVTPPIPLEVDDEQPVAETAEEPVAETTEATAPEAEPATTPVAKTDATPAVEATATPPAETAPVAPPAKSYAPDEVISLAEGADWTRAQIVEALRDRVQLQPKAADADTYSSVFRMSAADAKEKWGPVIDRLIAEPQIATYINGYLSDPQKQAYLDACSAHYDTEVGAEPAAPAQPPQRQAAPQTDPTLRRELDELKAFRDNALRQAAIDRGNRELAHVTQKYPFIATDVQTRNALFALAKSLFDADIAKGVPEQEARGLMEAMAMNAPLLDARMIVMNQQNAAPAEPAPHVPPTLGSPGASPTGTRQPKPKVFRGDLEDATEDWLANNP